MKKLTKGEEQIMQALWKIERGVVKDIIEMLPDPKPPYTTVSSVVRILEDKEFVGHKAYGRTHEYFPTVSKEDYSNFKLKFLLTDYFDGSFQSLVSFFAQENELSKEDIKELKELINKQVKE